jgi:hypothetical protein
MSAFRRVFAAAAARTLTTRKSLLKERPAESGGLVSITRASPEGTGDAPNAMLNPAALRVLEPKAGEEGGAERSGLDTVDNPALPMLALTLM